MTFAACCMDIGFLSTFPLRGTSLDDNGEIFAPYIFLSTFPLRGTSGVCGISAPGLPISIHVPLAGNVMERLEALHD